MLPPRRLIEEAEREQLDFFAITDHNTWAYPHFSDSEQVLVIAGVEVTMPYGHFNVFSVDRAEPDWIADLPEQGTPVDRDAAQAGRARELVERIAAAGLPASINHPLLFPWEWTDPDAPLDGFRYLEVWNDPTWPENRLANPAALDMWTRWLQAGLRVTALGGSDFHNPDKLDRFDGITVDGHRVGMPRSYVGAAARTPEAILEAVDHHRVYVTMNPTLELEVEAPPHGSAGIGDDLGAVQGTATVHAVARGAGELTVELLHRGDVVARATGHGPGLEHHLELDGTTPGWLRLDVRDSAGEVVAFTNPIWHGPEISPSRADYGTFTDRSVPRTIQHRWQGGPSTTEEEGT